MDASAGPRPADGAVPCPRCGAAEGAPHAERLPAQSNLFRVRTADALPASARG